MNQRMILALMAGVAVTGCTREIAIRPVGASPLAAMAAPSERVLEGRTQLALGNAGLAIESFRRALTADPKSVDALAGLAAAYERLGRFDVASQQLERALALAPDDRELLERLAANRQAEGKVDVANAIRRELAMREARADEAMPSAADVAGALALDDRLSLPIEAPRKVAAKVDPPTPDSPRLVRLSLGEIALVTKPGPIWEQAVAAVQQREIRSLRIEMLNAARVAHLAARHRDAAKERGWSNVAIGDAPEVRATSIVIYPPSARFAAARLAAQLGVGAQLDPSATHIKVLLGRDAVQHG
jgi:tetratricopeptide (TPR) repeat protein